MILAENNSEGLLNFVFRNDGRNVDETVRWRIKMGMLWRIPEDMRNQRYIYVP